MARCPAYDDRSPSLSISVGDDGKVLVRCHAGCDQRDLIAVLQARGLWQTTGRPLGIARNPRRRSAEEPDADALKRSAGALAIWQASQVAEGSLVATYLRSRGLHLGALPALRFHAGLKHPSGSVWPAMVGLPRHRRWRRRSAERVQGWLRGSSHAPRESGVAGPLIV